MNSERGPFWWEREAEATAPGTVAPSRALLHHRENLGSAARPVSWREALLLLGCVGALIAVEIVLIAPGHLLAGDIADAVLLVAFLQPAPGGPSSRITLSTSNAIRALALVPLVRVVSLGLPLGKGSIATGTLVVAILIGGTALLLAPHLAVMPRRMFAPRFGRAQMAATAGGAVLGLVAYLLGAPVLWPAGASGGRVLLGICAAVAAAAAEEIVYRGVVQTTLQRAIGRLGLLAGVGLFASTYLRAGSAALVLTMTLAGLIFAYAVARTNVLNGAVAGHVLLALGAGAVWPAVFGRHPSHLSGTGVTVSLAVVIALTVAVLLRRQVPRQNSALPMSTAPGFLGTPSVRIVITNHNYGEFVGEAIRSACRQDHPNVSVVVVDDGSTDDSRERLRAHADSVEIVLKEQGGQASAINAGLDRSQADIVMLLDADDVLKPEAASRVAAAFAAEQSLAKVQFRMDVVDAEGRPTGVIKPHAHIPVPQGDVRSAELLFPFDLSWSGGGGHAFRGDVLRRILPIPEHDYPSRGADWYLVHLSTLFGTVASLPEVCASYRVHGRNGYELQAPELDLNHVRETIGYARATSDALARTADKLHLERPEQILSLADLGNRLVSLKLEPKGHPIHSDRAWRLVLDSIRAADRRFDVRWPMKVMFVAWFAAMAAAPRPLARRLAEPFSFPERRSRLNAVLRRLNRGPNARNRRADP